jgi:protein-disulfide isomerase-like protein with CxxC motif
MTISVTHYSDPGCPWAYSASPALAVLRWRFSDQLEWRLVMIGLAETGERYEKAGYTPAGSAKGRVAVFRRFGMPLTATPKRRVSGTSRGCRAVVATRLTAPERELDAFRALQFMQFGTEGVLDDDDDLRDALRWVDGLDTDAVVGAIDSPEVLEAYERDRAEARTAEGSATEAMNRAATSDGPVRYTAPSLVFSRNGTTLDAGGFQPMESYDMAIANLDPTLRREPPPENALAALERFPSGLTTQEIAAILCPHLAEPPRAMAEEQLIDLVAEGRATRTALADDAVWKPS